LRKNIEIPEVEEVYLAAVYVFNEQFEAYEWNAYLINVSTEALEMALIVSRGYLKKKETSTMRHKIEVLPAKNFAKVEFLQEDVLKLNNEFRITFFQNNKMYEKTFIFKPNTIKENALVEIPVIPEKGILAK